MYLCYIINHKILQKKMEFKAKITITLTKDLLQWLENFQPNDLTNLITTFSNQAQLMGLIAESGMTSSKSS